MTQVSCSPGRGLTIRRVHLEGWPVFEAAEAAGISERTTYKWSRRYREEGDSGLPDRSSRPRRMPRRLPKAWCDRVLELRRERKMTGKAIAQWLQLGRSTGSQLLRRHRLSRARDIEPNDPPRRYERSEPGELLHLDVKKLGRIKGVSHRITGDRTRRNRGLGWDDVHVCIDGYRRLAYAEDQREGRALHPDDAARVGLRPTRHELSRANTGAWDVPQTPSRSSRRQATHQPTRAGTERRRAPRRRDARLIGRAQGARRPRCP